MPLRGNNFSELSRNPPRTLPSPPPPPEKKEKISCHKTSFFLILIEKIFTHSNGIQGIWSISSSWKNYLEEENDPREQYKLNNSTLSRKTMRSRAHRACQVRWELWVTKALQPKHNMAARKHWQRNSEVGIMLADGIYSSSLAPG